MKRALLLFAAAAVAALAFFQVTSAAPRPLSELVPSGPLIYLEAQQFSQLLSDWNNSPEKKAWLAGADAEVFNNSNLMIKLTGVYKEYAEAAGFSPDMAAVQTMAGDASALGLYDLREVQFLYITRLPADHAIASAVGKLQGRFQKREAAGYPFYVSSAKRTVAFAIADGYLILGTREDLVANCLTLIAAKSKLSVSADPWFVQATAHAKAAGELRMAMNLTALLKSTYFRSYWIQRNISEVKPFWTGVADIRRSADSVREDRVFLRSQSTDAPGSDARSAAAELARWVPADQGLYQIWAHPDAAKVTGDLEQQILNPRAIDQMASRFAPASPDGGNAAGSEADLEIRIDEPPLPVGTEGQFAAGPIEKLMAANPPLALMETRATRLAADRSFVRIGGAMAILGASDWDKTAVRNALSSAVESLWTTSGLGVQWKSVQTFDQMDGFAQVSFAVRGKLLIIATDAGSMSGVLDRITAQPVANSGADYLAGVSVARERARYYPLMRALDFSSMNRDEHEPPFFSQNVESLLGSLDRLTAVEMESWDRGAAVEQTVEYRLR